MVTVATNDGDGFALLQEREQERRDMWEEWSGRGVQGVGVALVDASGASAEVGGGRHVAAGAGHAPLVLLARGGGRLAGASGLGRAGGLGGLRQVSSVLSLLFCFYLFYYFYNFRALLKMSGHFHKS